MRPMSFSLYRKYRPQTFADVIGQEAIVATLLQQSATASFGHAYLFTGPRGVGKTTTARLLAKAANCESPKKNGEPCNTCASCKLIQEGKAIDIIEIDAASHTGVDHVREVVIETSRTSPATLKKKIFIIDEVHMLSSSAFNALLKTLEEPPEHACFILATTEVHKVPDTILSRCQRYVFKRISAPLLVTQLESIIKREKVRVDVSVLEEIARRAEGSSRDAESLLGQLMAFGDAHITKEQAALVLPRSSFVDVATLMHAVLARDAEKALAYISQFSEDGGSCEQLFSDTVVYCRYLLLERLGSKKMRDMITDKLPDGARSALSSDSAVSSPKDLVRLLEIFLSVRRTFWYQDIPELPLELAVCKYCDSDVAAAIPQSKKIQQEQPKERKVVEKKSIATSEAVAVKPAKRPTTTGSISLSLLKEKWQAFVNSIRSKNPSLSVSMQLTKPNNIDGNQLTLIVPYAFHKDRLLQTQTRNLLEKNLQDFFDVPLTLVIEVSSSDIVSKSDNLAPATMKENLWDQIVDAFGEELAPNG